MEEKTWKNVPFKTWKYEKQTEMKHRVLLDYLRAWAKIRSVAYNGLNFVDGFGGCGAYHTEEDIKNGFYSSDNFGSPIFSIESIIEQKNLGRIRKACVLIIDEKKENLENIPKILSYKKINFDPDYKEGDFDKEINIFIDKIKKSSRKLNPTFFFIDPFGFSLRFETIKRILELENTEVFVNFMYNAIQRFVNNKKIEKRFDNLFGCGNWKEHAEKHTSRKEAALIELFRRQCKSISEYVYPYKLNFYDQNRPYYYLFHLCNHYKGCVVMKDVFARLNSGLFEYKGQNKNRSFFDLWPEHKRGDLCGLCFLPMKRRYKNCGDCLLDLFSKRQIFYEDILREIIDLVPLTEQGIKNTLKDLENNNKINVVPDKKRIRKRRGGFVENDLIIFKK